MSRFRDAPTVIDLFAGCGGGSLGFVQAGLEPVAAVELDGNAADAYEANVGVEPIVSDIRKVTGDEVLEAAGINRGRCTLLFGCPPCQSFTILRRGSRATRRDSVRNSLYHDYLRLAGEIRPRHIAFENVPGMLGAKWLPHFEEFLDGINGLGYDLVWELIDAADYGVAQHRSRVLVVASRVARPEIPTPTHAVSRTRGRGAHVTVRRAIGSLEPLDSGEEALRDPYHFARSHSKEALRRLRAIPEGGGRADLPARLQLECHKGHTGHYDIYGRMWWDRPAPTITSGCTNITRGRFAHPEQDRAITLREAMILQSFPRRAVLSGTYDEMALQLGNAIPPLLARRIGEAVLQMEGQSRRRRSPDRGTAAARTPRRSKPTRSSANATV